MKYPKKTLDEYIAYVGLLEEEDCHMAIIDPHQLMDWLTELRNYRNEQTTTKEDED